MTIIQFLALTQMLLLLFPSIIIAELRGNHGRSQNYNSAFLEAIHKLNKGSNSTVDSSLHRSALLFQQLHSLITGGKCQHLYIDFGTSTAMEIRKLFEPSLYPNAPILQYFQKYFGPEENRKSVCAIGFEANPLHSSRLSKMQAYYQSRGFPAYIFTESLVSTSFSAESTLYVDENKLEKNHGWGTSAIFKTSKKILIPSLNVAVLLNELLQAWHANLGPKSGTNPNYVYVKMDIEGSEYTVLPHLMIHGILCQVNFMTVDWHPALPQAETEYFKKFYHAFEQQDIFHCPFKILEFEDETYFHGEDPHPLE